MHSAGGDRAGKRIIAGAGKTTLLGSSANGTYSFTETMRTRKDHNFKIVVQPAIGGASRFSETCGGLCVRTYTGMAALVDHHLNRYLGSLALGPTLASHRRAVIRNCIIIAADLTLEIGD